jgi:hypothetical protein
LELLPQNFHQVHEVAGWSKAVVWKRKIWQGTLLGLCLFLDAPAQSVPRPFEEDSTGAFIEHSENPWFQANVHLDQEGGRSSSIRLQPEGEFQPGEMIRSPLTPLIKGGNVFAVDPVKVPLIKGDLGGSHPSNEGDEIVVYPKASYEEREAVQVGELRTGRNIRDRAIHLLPLPAEKLSQLPLNPAPTPTKPTKPLDLPPEVIEDSPVLQRWMQEIPNVLSDINKDPSFRTRFRLGYAHFSEEGAGWLVGIEDFRVAQSRFTVSGDYQASFDRDQQSWGVDARYYVRPLGRYFNLAPIVGYRRLENDRDKAEGLHFGLRFLFVLSRTGAADIAFTPSWILPGREDEAGLTTLSFGYAVTKNLRLSTEFQKQNTRRSKDSRIGIIFEWMF